MKIKALSIREPYVERILAGLKPEEFRGQRCAYRGPLLLVSCKAFYDDAPPEHWQGIGEGAELTGQALIAGRKDAAYGFWRHPLGHVRGIARLTGNRVADVRGGKPVYGWRLEDVLRLEHPFPVRGKQGLYDVDLDKVATLEACRELAAWLAGRPPLCGPLAAGGTA